MIFEPHDEFIKNRVFGAGEQEQKDWQQEHDLLCAKVVRWYLRAQARIGKRIHAHFIATTDISPRPRLIVHVFPYGLFPTREAAKRHFVYCFCSTTVEDHGDAGLVVMHNLTPMVAADQGRAEAGGGEGRLSSTGAIIRASCPIARTLWWPHRDDLSCAGSACQAGSTQSTRLAAIGQRSILG